MFINIVHLQEEFSRKVVDMGPFHLLESWNKKLMKLRKNFESSDISISKGNCGELFPGSYISATELTGNYFAKKLSINALIW